MLEYSVNPNPLTTDMTDYVGRIQNQETITIDQIVTAMTGRGLSLTDTEVNSVINEFLYAINNLLMQGKAINTPIVRLTPSITGRFDGASDEFDASRHTIKINATPGSGIDVDLTKTKVHKVESKNRDPKLKSLIDYKSKQTNATISKAATAEIQGEDLKFDKTDERQGVFIVTDTKEIRVDEYMHVLPSQVIFFVPDKIPAGNVRIEIRSKTRGCKQIKSGLLKYPLASA